MSDNKQKLEFDDMIANNMVAVLISETSRLCGKISAIHDSINFDKLTEHKRNEILNIEHHLASALMHLQEYFMIRKEQSK
ncbi:MAG: hypothetical protein IKC77_07110 [Lentisphaeria bacterium]|nr:hypothetical protein [Lentisphaeria bacterium]